LAVVGFDDRRGVARRERGFFEDEHGESPIGKSPACRFALASERETARRFYPNSRVVTDPLLARFHGSDHNSDAT
jgi:hypothetical protein